MKLKKQLPKQSIVFTNTDPFTVNLLIDIMKKLGVSVYENSQAYDPNYPYLVWDRVISQSVGEYGYDIKADTIEEFVKYFVESSIKTIQLTDNYSATIHPDKVVVGCQEITFEKLEEVWNTMLEIRNV